ncbi:MAG: dTDP-4-dehydrorhamnose 3,5-epimerase family protein [Proteobacteria bacterium]|nr:dTDP-4-dehydrorhamnose 3,5-epimerase family protein [Pseudomonadota bacterium]
MNNFQNNEKLPVGTKLYPLTMNRDERGIFTEVFRSSWLEGDSPIQWNVVSSETNVLRGVHFHINHADYLILIKGKAVFALKDLRPSSPTEGTISMLEMSEDNIQALYIPPGVAHGFYFYTPAMHIYGVDHYWSHDDELGCRFDDPLLGISWPSKTPITSLRDQQLPKLENVINFVPTYQD